MAALRGRFVGAEQEAVGRPGEGRISASAPDAAELAAAGSPQAGAAQQEPDVDVPARGSKFSDGELAARFGVPTQGGIRVSHENRCIVLVDRVDGEGGYDDVDLGDTVRYEGQNHYGRKESDQVLDGNNLDLALSKMWGYTVLYFTKQVDVLVFDKAVECDSLHFEKKDGRRVIVFRLRLAEPRARDRLSPEVEGTLRSIESGTFAGDEYTIDEYKEYIKKELG